VIVVNAKKMIIVGAAALMLLVGAGVAYASGSGGDSSGQATGTHLDKAKSVALEHVNGRVTGSEVGDEEGAYEVEVTRDNGSQVDVTSIRTSTSSAHRPTTRDKTARMRPTTAEADPASEY
jgi:hypothetical protein